MRNGLAAWFRVASVAELRRRIARSLGAVGSVWAVVGCSGAGAGNVYPVGIEAGELHEFEVQLTSDLLVPKDVDSMRAVITSPGPPGTSAFETELGAGSLQLPAGLAAAYGAAAGGFFRAEVTVWKGAQPFTVVRAAAPIPASGKGVLRLAISWLCAGTATETGPGQVASTCPDGQSCRAGSCQADDRSAEVLPEVEPQGSLDACDDVIGCMADARVAVVDRVSCTIAKDPGFVATNFAVVKPPQTSGACTAGRCLVALNPDAQEGWSDVGSAIALPPALCAALADGRATEVILSAVCPSKWVAARSCDPGAAG
jgi:hypothetical protein